MKISASYWMFKGGLEGKKPIASAMNDAKQLGFDAIELCIAEDGVLTPQTTKSECKAILTMAKDIGIEIAGVASGHSWLISPTANDIAVRKQSIKFTKRALQITEWLETDAYLFVPGFVERPFGPASEIIDYEVCYKRAVQSIEAIIPAAEKSGVKLCVENVWNKFLLSPLEMRNFIDYFDSKNVAAYFDVGNILLTGFPEQWIRILGKRIKRIHVKDFKKSVGTPEGFVELGDGDVDFSVVKAALKRIQYDSYITAEMIPYKAGRPEKTAKAMKRFFK